MGYTVKSVEKGSIAEAVGIRSGDVVVDFNNQPFIDIIDYYFFVSKHRFSLGYTNQKGEPIKARIEKLPEEDLGITFERDLLGISRACGNQCIFCFVDQLPSGMRKSLYHKDEDWRYSLIYGNYVTLSYLTDKDLKRIKKRKISNLYVSVHTVDEEKRKDMLGRENIRPIKPLLRTLARYGVTLHAQIVLIPGENDGKRLEESYRFLKSLYPKMQSVSVIPVGVTGHRDGLYAVSEFDYAQVKAVIQQVESWQAECRKRWQKGFIYASDEMYVMANEPLPASDYYDGYPQIENGVGLITSFDDEFWQALAQQSNAKSKYRECTIITANAFYAHIDKYAKAISQRYNIKINTICAENTFFGGKVNIAGLLTGSDIVAAAKRKDLGEAVVLSANVLRDGEDMLLDDMRPKELEQALGCPVAFAPSDGEGFLNSFLTIDLGDNT